MDNIILVLVFGFLVQNVSCNEDLLTKFHQNGFKIKDFRMQLMNYDPEFYNFFEMKPFKFNRTTLVHNVTMMQKITSTDEIEIRVQAYKFYNSNEYRHFPIRFQVNFKKAFDANIIGLANIKKCGNITTFYFYKNVIYHCCNFLVDETQFPPLVPSGRYLLNITLLYLNKGVACVHLFVEVYTPTKYPK